MRESHWDVVHDAEVLPAVGVTIRIVLPLVRVCLYSSNLESQIQATGQTLKTLAAPSVSSKIFSRNSGKGSHFPYRRILQSAEALTTLRDARSQTLLTPWGAPSREYVPGFFRCPATGRSQHPVFYAFMGNPGFTVLHSVSLGRFGPLCLK